MSDFSCRDLYLSCRVCGNRFVHTPYEQRQLRQAGNSCAPDTCPACRALAELARRRAGRVEWYDRRRGYGFVRGDDGSSVFVHASALRAPSHGRLGQGMRVSYRVHHTERGPRAVEIEIQASEAASDGADAGDVRALGAPML